MPAPVTPPTAAPAAPKPQGQTPSPQQGQPMGQSSATQPISNRGAEAGAMQLIAAAKTFLDKASAMVGASSDMGRNIADVLKTLAKMSPAGSSSPQGEKNAMQNAMMSNAQNNQAMQQMRARMQQGQGGGGGAQPGMAA